MVPPRLCGPPRTSALHHFRCMCPLKGSLKFYPFIAIFLMGQQLLQTELLRRTLVQMPSFGKGLGSQTVNHKFAGLGTTKPSLCASGS